MAMYQKEFELTQKTAMAVGRYLLRMSQTGFRVSFKGKIDPVTEADTGAERLIISAIRKNFPEDDILTEETADQRRRSERRWIIDPLDGTTNFSHRFPFWCVSIAFEHQERIQAGAVYSPILGELFTARRGGGAFLNGRRIHVSHQASLKRCLLATGFPYDVHTSRNDNLKYFRRFIKRAQAVRRPGSAAMDLAYVACGRFDGFWEMKLKPWDMAAGALLVEEAGGRVTDFAGKRFSIYKPECLASNGWVHGIMKKILIGR
jgi:myo-inositol-1(or 4)-monophosphatase